MDLGARGASGELCWMRWVVVMLGMVAKRRAWKSSMASQRLRGLSGPQK